MQGERMMTYLTIITTALVVTQIIRVTQNHFNLHRQKVLFKKQLAQISDITDDDLKRQKEVYAMLYEVLKKKMDEVGE